MTFRSWLNNAALALVHRQHNKGIIFEVLYTLTSQVENASCPLVFHEKRTKNNEPV